MGDGNSLSEEHEAFAVRLADAAKQETLARFRKGGEVFNKAGIWFDPVTDADREAERVQRRMIEAVYPKYGIVGEEFGQQGADAEYRWVLDPVDGTRSFVCGLTSWTTLIALEQRATPILGVIDQPYVQERWIGDGTVCKFHHGDQVSEASTSGITSLAKARLSTTDPRKVAYFTASEASAFEEIAKKAQVTRFGLDAYSYAMVASGHIDLTIEAGLQHHDWAALVPVVTGAGGVITNWSGRPVGTDDRGETIAAATPELHSEVLEIINTLL